MAITLLIQQNTQQNLPGRKYWLEDHLRQLTAPRPILFLFQLDVTRVNRWIRNELILLRFNNDSQLDTQSTPQTFCISRLFQVMSIFGMRSDRLVKRTNCSCCPFYYKIWFLFRPWLCETQNTLKGFLAKFQTVNDLMFFHQKKQPTFQTKLLPNGGQIIFVWTKNVVSHK